MRMKLKSCNFTSKEPHAACGGQVADPCSGAFKNTWPFVLTVGFLLLLLQCTIEILSIEVVLPVSASDLKVSCKKLQIVGLLL